MATQMSISTIQSLQKIEFLVEAFQTLVFFNLCSSLVRGLLFLSKDKYTQRAKLILIRNASRLQIK